MKLKLKDHGFIHLRRPSQSITDIYNFDFERLPSNFLDGVFVASPQLYEAYCNREGLSDSKLLKLKKSIFKYWLRTCTRATPFGVFAGSGYVEISTESNFSFDNSVERLVARLDMEYLFKITQYLGDIPTIREQIKFYPNNSIYEYCDSFRYSKYFDKGTGREYHLFSAPKTIYLERLLKLAQSGLSIKKLRESLSLLTNIGETESLEYINQLVENQILVSELEPCLTNHDPFSFLINTLERYKGVELLLHEFKEVNRLIHTATNIVSIHKAVRARLEAIFPDLSEIKDAIQVDLIYENNGSIAQDDIDKILKQVERLKCFSRKIDNQNLLNFANSFKERYGEAFVPLVTALDADAGIGYANVKDSNIGSSELINFIGGTEKSADSIQIGNIDRWVLQKYLDYLKLQRNDELIIDDSEVNQLEGLSNNENSFPTGMFILGNYIRNLTVPNNTAPIFNLVTLTGPSSFNLSARFAYADSRLLNGIKRAIIDEESNLENAICAEIVHYPQSRLGNILLRPVLRDYEIPFLGRSGAPLNNQIAITDLLVGVKEGQIVLFSKSLNKIVIPRLTTAHNFYVNSLPLYRFLCELQYQNCENILPWDWGVLNNEERLPRVVYKNIVLKRGRWRVKLPNRLTKSTQEIRQFILTEKIRLDIKDKVLYISGEQELFIDFSIDSCLDILVDILADKSVIVLEEFLYPNADSKTNSPNCYTNEIVIPVSSVSDGSKVAKSIQLKTVRNPLILPFDNWLYFKVYCGSIQAEAFLKVLYDFTQEPEISRLIKSFFFIRYADPKHHLRIRFFNDNGNDLDKLKGYFLSKLGALSVNGNLYSVSIDTYEREVERYGEGVLMDYSEMLFWHDSIAVLEFIYNQSKLDNELNRLLFAINSINVICNDFGLNLHNRVSLISHLRESFFSEFDGDVSLGKGLNEKYRLYRNDIIKYLRGENDEFQLHSTILHKRSELNEKVVQKISEISFKDNPIALERILSSHIHMFINRLFPAHQRKYELLIYHFMERNYKSEVAIINSNL